MTKTAARLTDSQKVELQAACDGIKNVRVMVGPEKLVGVIAQIDGWLALIPEDPKALVGRERNLFVKAEDLRAMCDRKRATAERRASR